MLPHGADARGRGAAMPPKRHKHAKTFLLALPAARMVNYCSSAIRLVIPDAAGIVG
jgi:hypothetical protein